MFFIYTNYSPLQPDKLVCTVTSTLTSCCLLVGGQSEIKTPTNASIIHLLLVHELLNASVFELYEVSLVCHWKKSIFSFAFTGHLNLWPPLKCNRWESDRKQLKHTVFLTKAFFSDDASHSWRVACKRDKETTASVTCGW